MGIKELVGKSWAKYKALPTGKKILYTALFVVIHILGIAFLFLSKKIEADLEPLAAKMDKTPGAFLILGALIAIVSIPPLFGHEILALVAGYVYGATYGFLILTISSIIGESGVYFGFRYWFIGALDSYREKHAKNYGVFVAVVEDGGILMLWFIRMSVIPPHFSTPLFSSLRTITWWKWMVANIAASPVKFFPPVYLGTLLRSKSNNSIVGDIVFAVSTLVTVGVLWHINKAYKAKKAEAKERELEEAAAEIKANNIEADDAEPVEWSAPTTQYGELSTGVEMTPMEGRVRDDRATNLWPTYPNQPERAHMEDGQNRI